MNGGRIKEIREAHGWTQEFLSEVINVPVQQVNRYEKNKNKPSAEMVRRFAAGLMCSADYLLGLTDDPTPKRGDDELNLKERLAIDAWRQGKRIKAIKVIADDE